MKEASSLQELRVLRFATGRMDESTQRYFVESLHKLKKIQHLELYDSGFEADTAMWEAAGFVLPRSLCYLDLSINFSKLPSCINPSRLPNLSILRLRVNTMDEQDLENLARLPVLCFLHLKLPDKTMDGDYIKINVRDSCFQKLRYFFIDRMVKFELPNDDDSGKLVPSGIVAWCQILRSFGLMSLCGL